MNEITDELLRRQRALFLSKRRKFVQRSKLGKSAGGPSTQLIKAAAQSSPTNVGTVNFTLSFPGPVTGLTAADVQTTGSTVSGTLTPTVTGGPTVYNISIAGATGNGNINCVVPAGAAVDALGNPTPASNTATVVLDTTRPSVTINQALGQADPTPTSPITFTVVFSKPVTGFLANDVVITGTAGGTKVASLSGTGPTYSIEITGMTTLGTVIVNIPANAATDLAGNLSLASTSTDNTVNWAPPIPAVPVTINQAAGQLDPTNASPILFTVVFNEAVTGFTTGDVTFGGSTAGGTLVGTVSGGPTTYTVTVTGMTDGIVSVQIPAGVAVGSVTGGLNAPSTSTDQSVTYDTTRPAPEIDRALTQADPTSTSPIIFFVGWSEPVVGFDGSDVSFAGTTAGGTLVAVATLTSPTTHDISVTGMTTNGDVVATIPANVCTDLAGNLNIASITQTDNIVAWTGGAGGGFPDNATSANEFLILFI